MIHVEYDKGGSVRLGKHDNANDFKVDEDGSLLLREKEGRIVGLYAPGRWIRVFGASSVKEDGPPS